MASEMRSICITGLLIIFPWIVFCQYDTEGRVKVYQDERIDSLLQDYTELRLSIMENPDNKAIPGYRIQIFFDSGTNSSDRARQVRDDFLFWFPEIPAYVSWKTPNYRVRVGDFRSRLEAEKTLQLILIDYPNAWVIKDEINFPPLN
jgi:hypothetical protein